jgi:hypothetical protein
VQLINVYDPGDEIAWEHGFRHEIILPSTDLLSEDMTLAAAATGRANEQQLELHRPGFRCGRWPALFNCTSPDLARVNRRFPAQNRAMWVCNTPSWVSMMHQCGRLQRGVCGSRSSSHRHLSIRTIHSPTREHPA